MTRIQKIFHYRSTLYRICHHLFFTIALQYMLPNYVYSTTNLQYDTYSSNDINSQYQSQELQQTGTTTTIRILPPKQKTYPVLDQMEKLLFPGMNYEHDEPSHRLERLETAVFGDKQSGKISQRLVNLRSEIDNWQIANSSSDLQSQQNQAAKQAQYHPINNSTQYPNTSTGTYHQFNNYNSGYKRARQPDYAYQNYRLLAPLIQNVGRRSINKIFDQ